MLVATHSKLEETVFYPRVQEVDRSLVDTAQQKHRQLDQLLMQWKGMNLNDPQWESLFQDMGQMLLEHLDEEEQQLFPKVRQSTVDLRSLGNDRMNVESSMASRQAKT